MKLFLFLLLGPILLAGCQLSPGPLRSAAAPTAIPAAMEIRSTPIPAAQTNSVTATAASFATAILTTTPDMRVRGTQTDGPLRSAAAWTATFQAFTEEAHAQETKNVADSATQDAQYWVTRTAVVHALLTTVTPQVSHSYRSPNGKWLAQVILYPCTQVQTDPENWPDAFEILRINDQEMETENYFCGGQGAYGFEGKFWTPNSRFFYYTDAREGWPDGGYPWRRPISRFDTVTGKSETLDKAVFSPGQSRIAGGQNMDLVVWEVNSDTVRSFSGMPADQMPFGVIWSAWSPNGRSLAYITQTNCQDTYPCPTALNLVDTQSWQQTLLLDPSSTPMLTVDWVGADTLSLWGADFQTTWLLDLKTKTLTQMVPTVTPTLTPLPSSTPKP